MGEGDLQSLQGNWAKLSQAFTIDEEQDSKCLSIVHGSQFILPSPLLFLLLLCADLEDDSPQLDEVKELFSDITLPLKVDKLAKVP